MTAARGGRWTACLLALALPALPALAGGWSAHRAETLGEAGERGNPPARAVEAGLELEGRFSADEAWLVDPGSCVLATVFDAVDGVEHVGTGAWLELETSVDHARSRRDGRSSWGASVSDWHHEASFWLLRQGTREGVVLASGDLLSELVPLEVSRTRSYRLVVDETGAHLSVDGDAVASLPLAPRRSPGPPALRVGAGGGFVRASLTSLDHGCLRPIETRTTRALDGSLSVTLLGHEGFRPALEIEAGSLRVAGREAPLSSLRELDADGDGQLDLVAEWPAELAPPVGTPLSVDARTDDGTRLRGASALLR